MGDIKKYLGEIVLASGNPSAEAVGHFMDGIE
jgi:hypothetical protein